MVGMFHILFKTENAVYCSVQNHSSVILNQEYRTFMNMQQLIEKINNNNNNNYSQIT